MRYDIKILWVEDTPTFFNESKEILEMLADDKGISLDFEYEQNGEALFNRIAKAETGFKVYDIFFIDYSLSGIVGNDIIKELRKYNIDSDILFYSSDYEKDIRKVVAADLGSYEGVYIAGKEDFEEKSNYLINKNVRRLLSLSNIRGVLMDQTSENDYTMKSYILRRYDLLSSEHKKIISEMLIEHLQIKSLELKDKIANELEKLESKGITSINKVMGLSSYLFPHELKYQIFEKIINFGDEEFSNHYSIEDYVENVIKARNNLAHKKLDICKTQQYILYYDNIKQFESRQCPKDCSKHEDSNKISITKWEEVRKDVIKYGKYFDEIQEMLKKESNTLST